MPEMDGWEATQEIRRTENGIRRVPVIAVTASVMEADRLKCLAGGMDDFVAKPIQKQILARVLAKWSVNSSEKCQEAPASRLIDYENVGH